MVELLPSINASFNAASAACLVTGFILVRRKQVKYHRMAMVSALFFSTCFLVGYLIYHSQVGSQKFPGVGLARTVYLTILIPHSILAAVMLPMIFLTFKRALAGDLKRHAKLARWTLPVWFFVSVTGVVIYWMLYRISWA
jgi:putative membrane protein